MNNGDGCLAAWVVCFVFFLLGYGTAYVAGFPDEDVEVSYSIAMETREPNTTETTTMTTLFTESETTSITITTTETTCTMTYLGVFTGTYYKGSCIPCYGGSGRMLVSCSDGYDGYKGSVASRMVYEQYGYHVNEKTMVYIEFEKYPELDGWYSVDDCNADPGIVDFYFADYSTCPWRYDGVTTCKVWI